MQDSSVQIPILLALLPRVVTLVSMGNAQPGTMIQRATSAALTVIARSFLPTETIAVRLCSVEMVIWTRPTASLQREALATTRIVMIAIITVRISKMEDV